VGQPILAAAAFQAAFFALLKYSLMKRRFRSARHNGPIAGNVPGAALLAEEAA
jgi:hypothetical protein